MKNGPLNIKKTTNPNSHRLRIFKKKKRTPIYPATIILLLLQMCLYVKVVCMHFQSFEDRCISLSCSSQDKQPYFEDRCISLSCSSQDKQPYRMSYHSHCTPTTMREKIFHNGCWLSLTTVIQPLVKGWQ
jgi:hypothetical protein